MKKITGLFRNVRPNIFAVALLLYCFIHGHTSRASQPSDASPAPVATVDNSGGISDAEIRSVIERVVRHQLRPPTNGDYPAVTNLTEAAAAKPRRRGSEAAKPTMWS